MNTDNTKDYQKIQDAEEVLKNGGAGDSWNAFVWIFHSNQNDLEGFTQTAERIGLDPEKFKDQLLSQSQKVRAFFFGTVDDKP